MDEAVVSLAKTFSLLSEANNPLRFYGSTITFTNAGKLSAPFLSVTRNLNRYVRGSETIGARKDASELLASSSAILLPRTWLQL